MRKDETESGSKTIETKFCKWRRKNTEGKEEDGKEELRYIVYRCNFSMMNVIIIH